MARSAAAISRLLAAAIAAGSPELRMFSDAMILFDSSIWSGVSAGPVDFCWREDWACAAGKITIAKAIAPAIAAALERHRFRMLKRRPFNFQNGALRAGEALNCVRKKSKRRSFNYQAPPLRLVALLSVP